MPTRPALRAPRSSSSRSLPSALRGTTAVFLAPVLLLTGCMVGPNYSKPNAPIPAAFKESPPTDWKPAQPQDAAKRGKWWEVFGDTELNALEEKVNVSNQNIAQAEAQYRSARAGARIARAGLSPTLGVNPSVTRSNAVSRTTTVVSETGAAGTPLVTTGTGTAYSIPVDFNYELDVWGAVRRQLESSVASAQASGADLETMRLSMAAELATDYFQLRGLDSQRQLLDSTANGYETALKLTVERFRQGVVSGVDVAQAETQLDQTRAQATDESTTRQQLEHAIAVLTGQAPADLTIAAMPLKTEPPQVPLVVPSELLERRPDIAGSERRMAAANAQIGVAVAAFYPTISLSASGGFASIALNNLFAAPGRFWSLGLQLAETIFDGGRRRAVKEQAQANYDATVAGYRQNVLSAFQDVEDNLSTLRLLELESKQQADAVKAAERALTLANNRYQGGITTYLEVITAQATALSNERTAIDILSRRMTAGVNLVKALGGGWQVSDLPAGSAVLSRQPGNTSAPGIPPVSPNPQ
jgi:NodT family efflux transporter outer membrane factor (OMF) lipoprotein